MRLATLFLAAVVLEVAWAAADAEQVAALPDDVVPEPSQSVMLSETANDDTAMIQEVQATINKLKKDGTTDKDCKDLAVATCSGVERETSQAQKTIDALDDGATCNTKGDDSVGKQQKEVATREQDLSAATASLAKVKKETIKIDPQPASELWKLRNGGTHHWAYRDNKYWTSWVARKTKGETAVTTGKAKVLEAKKALGLAQAAAKLTKKNCRCKTKKNAKATYAAQLKLMPARKNEYRKCQLMKCVLDGVSMVNCKLKELKDLQKRKLTKETEEASCEEEKAKTPNPNGGPYKKLKAGETILVDKHYGMHKAGYKTLNEAKAAAAKDATVIGIWFRIWHAGPSNVYLLLRAGPKKLGPGMLNPPAYWNPKQVKEVWVKEKVQS